MGVTNRATTRRQELGMVSPELLSPELLSVERPRGGLAHPKHRLGGPTDARENLKKLRRQLGLRNN